MSFVSKEVLTKLSSMSENELDMLDFGAVKLSDQGVILQYNRYQSELANVQKAAALGKIFFKDIAPCTQNGLFHHKFKKGVETNNLDTSFPYTFTYKMKPTNVQVHLFRCPVTKANWVLVKKA